MIRNNKPTAYWRLICNLRRIKFLSEWPAGMCIWVKNWNEDKMSENDYWDVMLTWPDMQMPENENWHQYVILPPTQEEFARDGWLWLDRETMGDDYSTW